MQLRIEFQTFNSNKAWSKIKRGRLSNLKVARCRISQEAGNETRTTLFLPLWWLTQLKPLRFQHMKHVLSFDAISHSNQIDQPNTALAQIEEKEEERRTRKRSNGFLFEFFSSVVLVWP